MSFKVVRPYANGFVAEVTGGTMKEVLEKLAQADDIFYDTKAIGKDEGGKWVVSEQVRFQVRHVEADGRPCKYFEQVCMEKGPLQYFKRHIGEYQKRPGEMYVQNGDPKDTANCTLGAKGWHKYNGTGGGGGQQAPQQYAQQPPQQQYAQAPRQAPAPQQQYAPASSYSNDDIPF